METMMDIYKKIVEEARASGISDEDIKNYFLGTLRPGRDETKRESTYNKITSIRYKYVETEKYMEDKDFIKTHLDEIMDTRPEKQPEGEEKQSKVPAVDTSKFSNKAKKLIEKVNKLVEKIETEKSIFLRHVLTFKVKMLIAKIQKEIDLSNLRESYAQDREELKAQRESDELDARDNIAYLVDNIKRLKREIDGNEEYDAESKEFVYPQEYVARVGGPEALADELEKSDKTESKQAATRIRGVAQKRKELERLEEQLKEEQEQLRYSEKDYKKDISASKREETAMLLKQRISIFSGIKTFFTNFVEQVKLYREEKRKLKELDLGQKEEEKAIEEEYQKRMEELKEQEEKAKEEMRQQKREEKEKQQSQSGKDTAANFRQQMFEMAKGEETAATTDTQEQGESEHTQSQGESEPTQTQGETEVEETVTETGDDGLEH